MTTSATITFRNKLLYSVLWFDLYEPFMIEFYLSFRGGFYLAIAIPFIHLSIGESANLKKK